MKATPLFLGACALASITGAVSGANINTAIIQKAGVGSAEITRPAIAFDASDTGHDQVALPDHYAMNTPAGRIEVGELADRGIYSQKRYGWRAANFAPPPEPAFADPQPADDVAPEGDTQHAAIAAADTAPVPISATAQASLALAKPATIASPPQQPAAGGSKVIDVAATLALRD